MKKKISVNDLCKDLPSQIKEFTNYVKLLEFEENPDYYYQKIKFYPSIILFIFLHYSY